MWLRRASVVAGVRGPLPWPEVARACPVAFVAAPPDLTGHDRWRWLIERVLNGAVPDLVASCNGRALDDWPRSFPEPTVSASCTSGLHALFLARHLLRTQPEVVLLAADILSAQNHRNFEALRVVDADARPFAAGNPGFIPGEAAVALHLTAEPSGVPIAGPVLGDELGRILATLPARPQAVIAQGTGPEPLDRKELSALPAGVPVSTPLTEYGHTLGASGALAVALAKGPTLVVNRALTGACAAVLVGVEVEWPQPVWPWQTPIEAPSLHHPILRRLVAEAPAHRPDKTPELLVICLPHSLSPPPSAVLNGRLLPGAVREITPGFAAALLANVWGFAGPATALVGAAACAMLPPMAYVLHLDDHDVRWPH